MKNRIKSFITIFFIGGLLVSSVFYIIESVSLGTQIAKLDSEEQELMEKNRELNDLVVNSSSLTGFEKKKEDMGFLKPTDVVYLKGETGVAKLP